MPALACPRCQRANPDEAVFCYFDGAELRPVPGVSRQAANQLPHEFVFPSGRRCRTYEDLVQGCQYEWEDARDLLQRGEFQQYLARIDAMDRKGPTLRHVLETNPDALAIAASLDATPKSQRSFE